MELQSAYTGLAIRKYFNSTKARTVLPEVNRSKKYTSEHINLDHPPCIQSVRVHIHLDQPFYI